jgi:hypothetical protein
VRIAIGPARDFPSWHWCGGDLIPEMRRLGHDVRSFRTYRELSRSCSDAVLIIKSPSPVREIMKIARMAYIPVDFFETMGQIEEHLGFLRSCQAIATHCSRLDPYLLPHCRRLSHVEHHGKYVLPGMSGYKAAGPVLWTGQGKYARHILEWHDKAPRGFDLIMLANDRGWRREAARRPGVALELWSGELHMRRLGEARAGIDIKGTDFEQSTKPPTKAQQCVASGVPMAVDRESYAWQWFHERGFDLADPDDEGRWFGKRYWEETREFGLHLRDEISKPKVAASYLDLLGETP